MIYFRLTMNQNGSRISLNCSLSVPPTTQEGGHTPNTPEILNTIVNMNISSQPSNISITQSITLPSSSYSDTSNTSTLSSMFTPLSLSSSSFNSPQESHSVVQDFHSQFIKEGLKMKVKQKLKMETEDSLQEQLSRNVKIEKEVKRQIIYLFP